MGKHYLRCLAAPTGVWLHWLGTRHAPCEREACRYCPAGLPQELKHYVPALLWKVATSAAGNVEKSWEPVVGSLTHFARASLELTEWRGVVLELWRKDGTATSELVAKVYDGKLAADQPLPDPFDVRPVLLNLWNVRDRILPSSRGRQACEGSGPGQVPTLDDLLPEVIPFPTQTQKGGA